MQFPAESGGRPHGVLRFGFPWPILLPPKNLLPPSIRPYRRRDLQARWSRSASLRWRSLRSHLAVIKRATALAQRNLAAPCVVLTFEPHPADYFQGSQHGLSPLRRATPRRGRAGTARYRWHDRHHLRQGLASLPAEAFIVEILVGRLKVRAVVVPAMDFHFGAGRSGSPALLKEAGEAAWLCRRDRGAGYGWRGGRHRGCLLDGGPRGT